MDGQVTGSISGATGDGGTWSTGSGGKVWSVGDLNYDGNVDSDDAALFGEGLALGTYAPTQLQASGTYETRFDVTWAEGGLTNILGYALEYWPGTSSSPSGATTLYVSSLDPSVALFGNTDNRFGETIASLTDADFSDTDRSTAVVDGTDSSVSADSDYRVMIGAIVGTRSATPYWSDPIVAHTSNTASDPELQLPSDTSDGTLKVQRTQNDWEPEGIEIRASSIYHDLWIKRVDDSTGATTLLPIDHGDFADISGSSNIAGSIDEPAYLDTNVDFTHQYTYYACLQTGVPSVNAYWQMISNTDFIGAPYSYKPNPVASNLAAYQTFDGSGNIAVHLTWTVSADDQQDGFDLEWSSDDSTFHAIDGLTGKSRDHVFTIDDAGASPLSGTYYFRVKGVAGGSGNVITQTGSYSTASPLAIDSSYNSGSNLKVPTAAPTGVSETSSTTTSVTLQWTNIGDGDWHSAASIKRYVWIDAATEAGGYKNYYQVPVGGGTNSAVISGLISGTIYHFILRCVASPGVGYGQSVASTTFTTATIPSDIDSITANAFSSSLIQVVFSKSSDPDIHYQLQHSTTSTFADPTVSGNVIPVDNNQSTYNGTDVQDYSGYYYDDTGRSNHQIYHYRVRAVVTVGSSIVAGAWNTLIGGPTTYPTSPTGLTLVSRAGITATLSWTNGSTVAPTLRLEDATATFSDDSGAVHAFESGELSGHQSSDTVTTDTDEIINNGLSSESFIVTGLDASKQYTFRLAAYDPGANQFSLYSNLVSTTAPPSVTHVSAVVIGPTAVKLTWDYHTGDPISTLDKQVYEGSRVLNEAHTTISWKSVDASDTDSISVGADNTTYTISGLDPTKEYEFTITPTNNIGNSATSITTVATLPAIDSEDSFRLGKAYQYLNTSGFTPYYSDLEPASTTWDQFDSAASALASGATGSLVAINFLLHNLYTVTLTNTDAPADSSPIAQGTNYNFPFSDLSDDHWNYIAFYEDSLGFIPPGGSTLTPINDGAIRWSVEDRPTVSVAVEGVITDGGSTYAEYKVTRSGDDANALRVIYHASPADSIEAGLYDAPAGVIYIEPGQSSGIVKVRLHSGYHVGAITLAIDQSDESDASTVGSPYVIGTNSSASDAVYTVNTTSDTVAADGVTSLREAISYALSYTGGPITISFDPAVFPVTGSTTIELSDTLDVTGSNSITIEGPGASALDLDTGGSDGIIDNSGHLTVEGASVTSAFADGAALKNSGTLTVNNCTFFNSLAFDDAGAIWSAGTLNMSGDSIDWNNAGGSGGGIFVHSGTANLQGCEFSGDNAKYGGGLYIDDAPINLTDCTFTGCEALSGGAILFAAGNLSLWRCTITGNTGDDDGGGVAAAMGLSSHFHMDASTSITGNYAGLAGTEDRENV